MNGTARDFLGVLLRRSHRRRPREAPSAVPNHQAASTTGLQDAPEGSVYTTPRTYFAGAGGLVTTTADYMRFSRMLANGGSLEGERILGPRTLEYMRMNHLPRWH